MKNIVSDGFSTSLILQQKNAIYGVIQNEDGTLTFIDVNGQPCPNTGSIICSNGGVDATLLKCYKSAETFGEIVAKQASAKEMLRKRQIEARERIQADGKRLDINGIKLVAVDGNYYRYKYPDGWHPISEDRYLEIKSREESTVLTATTAYNNLLQTSNGVIETTRENLKIVMKYLNTENAGCWILPKMTITYTADQCDCEGKMAVILKLDEPIPGGYETKFAFGAPVGYLPEYKNIR